MENMVFALWKINIVENIRMKASLAKNFHIQPSEIDKMMYWEYEMFIDALNNIMKDENDAQQKEMDKYHVGDAMKMMNPRNMDRMTQGPKMPDMSKMKMPKMV